MQAAKTATARIGHAQSTVMLGDGCAGYVTVRPHILAYTRQAGEDVSVGAQNTSIGVSGLAHRVMLTYTIRGASAEYPFYCVESPAGSTAMLDLKALRERHFLTQQELADRLGVQRQQTISDWERGAARPQLRHQRALCAVLQVTADDLRAALDAVQVARREAQHHA